MRKRPYLTKEMCIRVVRAPTRVELQEQNRYRFWGQVEELQGRFLRVVTLSDKLTIHNAFLDRRFKPLKLIISPTRVSSTSIFPQKQTQRAGKVPRAWSSITMRTAISSVLILITRAGNSICGSSLRTTYPL